MQEGYLLTGKAHSGMLNLGRRRRRRINEEERSGQQHYTALRVKLHAPTALTGGRSNRCPVCKRPCVNQDQTVCTGEQEELPV